MATLTNTVELVTDVIDAFKVRFPMISAMATDFSSDEARLGDTIRGRVTTVPTAANYDGTDGYKTNTEANSLTEDVDIVLNQHKHVPVKIDYINQISTKRNLYNEVVGQMAYQLGKTMTDFVLSKVTQANFTHEITGASSNGDLDLLEKANLVLNKNGASPSGRYGIVDSATFSSLITDDRIASGDYHGQRRGGNAYGIINNVGGFEQIFEYPDLPAGTDTAEADASRDALVQGFFADRTALVVAARVPTDMDKVASALGVPSIAKTEVVSDPDTGLSFMNITYQDPHTFDMYTTTTVIYGAYAGAEGGTDNSGTDKGGVRFVSELSDGSEAAGDAFHTAL